MKESSRALPSYDATCEHARGWGVTSSFTESMVEDAALVSLESIGWAVKHGLQFALGEPALQRFLGVTA